MYLFLIKPLKINLLWNYGRDC